MIFIFIVLLVGNLWIWELLKLNLFLGILLLLSAFLLFDYFIYGKKILFFLSIILLTASIFVGPRPVINLAFSKDESIISEIRLKEYPPITFLPVAHWLEERPETVAIYKMTQNLCVVIDPNLYFFANHPRERALIKESEKFPYILLPFWVLGNLILVSKKRFDVLLFLGLPLVYYTIFGLTYYPDPFLLFPYFILTIFTGVKNALSKIPDKNRTLILTISIAIYALIIAQSIFYAIY